MFRYDCVLLDDNGQFALGTLEAPGYPQARRRVDKWLARRGLALSYRLTLSADWERRALEPPGRCQRVG